MRVLAWPAFRNKESNPYNFLLYSHLQDLGVTVLDMGDVVRRPRQVWRLLCQGVDVLHLHWPEHALGLSLFRTVFHMLILFGFCLYHRFRGGKVVWTVHNLSPHENNYPFLEKWFYSTLARVVDGLIFLTETSLALFRKEEKMYAFSSKPATVIPHGHYLPVYPKRVDKAAARRLLDLPSDGRVILFLGSLRPYKGVEELLAVSKEFSASDRKVFFVVAGKPFSEEYRECLIRLSSRSDSYVRLFLEHVPEDRVPLFFSAADVAVFPYRRILNSGSVFLSLTFGVPVLVPRLGSLEELAQSYPHMLYLYEPPLTKEKLSLVLDQLDLFKAECQQEWDSFLKKFDWSLISEQTLMFYKSLKLGGFTNMKV